MPRYHPSLVLGPDGSPSAWGEALQLHWNIRDTLLYAVGSLARQARVEVAWRDLLGNSASVWKAEELDHAICVLCTRPGNQYLPAYDYVYCSPTTAATTTAAATAQQQHSKSKSKGKGKGKGEGD